MIVGAGHAAGQLVASLVQRKADFRITLVGDEGSLPYQRPPLSKKFLAGEIDSERLLVRPAGFFDTSGISVHTGTTIRSIDRARRVAVSGDSREFRYDRLVLALGSRARELKVPGSELEGIHTLRSIDDVTKIRPGLAPGCRLTIIGAGYIGLEVAAVAVGMGVDVTVIESASRVMSRAVSEEVSRAYAHIHRERGVSLMLGAQVRGFAGSGRVSAVELADGQTVVSDIVIVGIGAVPNTELAERSGLRTGDGIVVDKQCVTSDPSVLAIGDCTQHPNPLLNRSLRLESVHNALEQAKTAAAVLCGEAASYAQVPWFWSDQYDLKLQIAGIPGDHDETVLRGSVANRRFSVLSLKDRRLVAIEAVNSPMDFVQARPMIATASRLDPDRLGNESTPLKDCAS